MGETPNSSALVRLFAAVVGRLANPCQAPAFGFCRFRARESMRIDRRQAVSLTPSTGSTPRFKPFVGARVMRGQNDLNKERNSNEVAALRLLLQGSIGCTGFDVQPY